MVLPRACKPRGIGAYRPLPVGKQCLRSPQLDFAISICSLCDVLGFFLPVSKRQPPSVRDVFSSCLNSFDLHSMAVLVRMKGMGSYP